MSPRAAAVALIVFVSLAACTETPATSVEGITVYNADAAQMRLVEWAVGRFTAQGLEPPPATHIVFPPTPGCAHGDSGVAHHNGVEGHVEICVAPDAFATGGPPPVAARRTILHELGHLWAAAHVDAATRRAFLEHRHLKAWKTTPVETSGSETAAEILMWGLLDETLLTGTACETWSDAFEVLTGERPKYRFPCLPDRRLR